MKLAIVRETYKTVRPRLPGAFLVSVIHCVPIYVFTWCFSVIDDLSARVSISLLVAMLPVEELLSEPRPWKKRGEQYGISAFFVLALLLAAADEFDWHGLAINVVVAMLILPYGWLVWKLMRGSGLLLMALVLAIALTMVYWTAALAGDESWFELLLLPVPVVIFGGIIWAPLARKILDVAGRRKDCPLSGPGMQALTMATLFLPVIIVAVAVPGMLDLSPAWSAVSLTIVGVLLSSLVASPLRVFLLRWGKLEPASFTHSEKGLEDDRPKNGG
ncbi:MAG: hypothetical protein OXL97_14595 [Chloroflexota bacterium]|nr:hypothetical protein [Chloroflexota bacterium]MDE2885433.1 hypothetical protein [Chloroflexota bacterium]